MLVPCDTAPGRLFEACGCAGEPARGMGMEAAAAAAVEGAVSSAVEGPVYSSLAVCRAIDWPHSLHVHMS